MKQLFGHTSAEKAYTDGTGVHYWVETRAPSKQALMRSALWNPRGRTILEAPVIVMIHDYHVQVRYLNEMSTEAEIEEFTRKYELDEQQRKWCFAALEEIAPVDLEV